MVREDRCIGCGACDFSCHTNALTKVDSFFGLFQIDPYTCDDCKVRVGKCPESVNVHGEAVRLGNVHFIADLFRAYHDDVSLYDPPFAD